MKQKKTIVIVAICLAALLAVSPLTHGASKDSNGKKGFSGKWKGEIQAPSFGGRGGAPQQLPGQRFVQRGGGGGRGFGGEGGGFPGGNRGAFGGPQKVTLNIKTKDNDTKATGNMTVGEIPTDDIRDAKIDGNKITFRSGMPTAFEYSGILDGDQIMMTRLPANAGQRGGAAIQFTLKRS